MSRLILIAAVAENGVIGAGVDIPWDSIPEDRRRFVRLTKGHPVIMGRKTYESLPEEVRPLPKRTNIVISRSQREYPSGVIVCSDVEAAVQSAFSFDAESYVIGGGEVYAQTIDRAHRLEITEVRVRPDGDAFFPKINPDVWSETERNDHEGFSFVTYNRIRH